MRCKECKEKIADNVKYCPECGALVNDIKYTIAPRTNYIPAPPAQPRQYTPYQPPQQQGRQTPPVTGTVPKMNKKLLYAIIAIVVVLVYVVMISLSTAQKHDDFYDYEVNVEDSVYRYDNAESAAIDYIYNIYDCDACQDTDVFLDDTALDWSSLFVSIYYNSFNPENEPLTGSDDSYGFVHGCISEQFDALNNDYEAGFEPYYFYTDVVSQVYIETSGSDYYCDLISKCVADMGLDASDYIDFDAITEIHEFSVDVSCEDTDCTQRFEIGTCTVAVAEINGDYKVLYDDMFIEKLLNAL